MSRTGIFVVSLTFAVASCATNAPVPVAVSCPPPEPLPSVLTAPPSTGPSLSEEFNKIWIELRDNLKRSLEKAQRQ